ncbi:hypothetical protein [Devosia sp.]|uniref:hypothetical protein n=1 Tax=Devosia sp. TaxID=1871048 RepID=UPI002FC97490
MKAVLITMGLALLAGAALAQEDLVIDQTKLYVSDPAACQALEKQGLNAWTDMDFLSLTFTGGIQSMEFHCNFYDIKSRPNTPLLFAEAVCELPGELYADTIAIAPNDATSIRLVSSADSTLALLGGIEPDPESPYPAGTTIYHRCDNLSEIPLD